MTVTEFYDCDMRELYAFIEERSQVQADHVEQMWDYSRHIMWAGVKPHIEKNLEPWQLIRLKRDGRREELTPWENQELEAWNRKMDQEMIKEGKQLVSW